MFGSTSFTFGSASGAGAGAAGNNAQQQPGQQQQAGGTGLFGAPAAQPGAQGGGFGGFGAPAQQQQPSTGGGLFGAAPSAAPSTGAFGFGQPQQAQQQQPGTAGGGLFGAPKPATTGAFGAPAAAGAAGAFGQPQQQQQQGQQGATGFGGFGAQPSTGAFGSTFGAPKPAGTTSLFGAPSAGGAPAFGSSQPTSSLVGGGAVPTSGTSHPPYTPHVITEKDGAGVSSQTFAYQTITCLPAYQKCSVEELRVQDYAQGRKSAAAAPGAQGAQQQGGGLFGQQQQPQTGGGLFGQQQQPQQGGGLFGAQPQQQQGGTGLFGQSNTGTTTGGGLFGQPQQQQQQGGGLFGQQSNTTTGTGGGLFGQSNTNTTGGTTGGFSFGQPQQQQGAATTGFGATGAFGQQQQQNDPNKPAGTGLFGGFGSTTQQQQQPAAGGFSFGQPQQQQQQQQTGGLFGSTAGANNNTAGGGLFGAKPAGTGLFGSTAGAASTGAPAFGGFGAANNNNAQQQQNKPAFSFGAAAGGATTGGGAFGGGASGGGLFGAQPQQQQQQQQQPGQTGGLFGGFGQTNASQPQQQQQAGGGLFGGASTTGGSLFGNNNANAAKPAFGQPGSTTGGGLFGSTAGAGAGSTTGAFGSTGTGGGLFGAQNQQQQPGQQQQQQPQTGGLFGGGTSLFGGGAAKPAFGQPAGAGGGLFGSAGTAQGTGTGALGGGGGLFGGGSLQLGGAQQNQQQQQQPGQLGQLGQQQQQPGALGSTFGTGGGGLFGAKPALGGLGGSTLGGLGGSTGGAAGGGGLFGSSTFGASQLGGGLQQQQQPLQLQQPQQQGLFQQQQLQQQQQGQQSLNMSLLGVDQNPYGTDSLFGSTLPHAATGLNAQQPLPFNVAAKSSAAGGANAKKPPIMPGVFASPRNATKVTRLRGSTPAATNGGSFRESTPVGGASGFMRESTPGLGSASASAAGRYGSPSLFRGLSDEQGLAPGAFVTRPNVKKLVLDDTTANLSGSFGRGGTGGSRGIGRASTLAAQASPANGSADASKLFSHSFGAGSTVAARQSAPSAAEDTSLTQLEPSLGSASRRSVYDASNVVDDSPLRSRGPGALNRNVAEIGSLSSSAAAKQADEAKDKLEMGYFTSPTLASLRVQSFDQLANVSNFVVGREGFGKVHFDRPVDLTTAPDLMDVPGGLVQIRTKECYVYPDAEDFDDTLDGVRKGFRPPATGKMPVGEGLNQPATISLEKCWALDRATRAPIKDPNHPRYKQHINKLRNREDCEFVDFDPATGTWTFRVEHFSRYGLDDDDESEEEQAVPAARKAGAEVQPAAKNGRSLRPRPAKAAPAPVEELSEEEEGTVIDEDDEEEEEEREETPAPKHFAAQLGLEARKMQVMQASFFGQGPENTKALGAVNTASPNKAGVLGSNAAATRRERSQPPQQAVTARPTFSAAAPVAKPLEMPSRKFAKTTVSESVIKGAERLALDPVLARARSFRPAWGPAAVLVARPAEKDSSVSNLQLPIIKLRPDSTSALAVRMLERQLASTEIEFDEEEGVPMATASMDTRFKQFSAEFAPNDKSHEALVWRLGSVLFDEIDLGLQGDIPRELANTASNLRRKAALSRWLSFAVSANVDADARVQVAAGNTAAQIFAYLTGHQVERASRAAIENKDFYLASLLAQLPGDDEMRASIALQLATWREEGADAFISTEHRKLYELMAGNVNFSAGSVPSSAAATDKVPDLPISEGLDWKRAFGLHLWYRNQHEVPLERAVATYESAVGAEEKGASAPPLPPYLEDASKRGKVDLQERDILFHLLKIYSDPVYDLETTLAPRGYSARRADYRLGWQLSLLLSQVLRIRDFADRTEPDVEPGTMEAEVDKEGNLVETEVLGYSATADTLTSHFAAQLEDQGFVEWSAFVLLHLQLPDYRAATLRALIERNIERLTAHQERFLVEQLLIPPSWIFRARAIQAARRGDKFSEYQLLLQAELYLQAHRIAVYDLAPEAIIRCDHNLILKLFARFPSDIEIPGWKHGGQVLTDFVAVVLKLPRDMLRERQLLGASAEEDEDEQYSNAAGGAQQAAARKQQLAEVQERVRRSKQTVSDLIRLVPEVLYRAERTSRDPQLERGRLTRYVAKNEMMTTLQNLARLISVHAAGSEIGADFGAGAQGSVEEDSERARANQAAAAASAGAAVAPEVGQVQNAANDYLSLLVDTLA